MTASRTLTREEVDEARAELRAILERQQTVYAVVKHVSGSGMRRVVAFYVMTRMTRPAGLDPRMRPVSHLVSAVYHRTDRGRSRSWTYDRGGVVIDGTGMDMGWWIIYTVRARLGLGDDDGKPGYGFRLEYL